MEHGVDAGRSGDDAASEPGTPVAGAGLDRRTLLKLAGAAAFAAPALDLLANVAGSVPAAVAATAKQTTTGTPTLSVGGANLRPPSIPLATRSPYVSTWLPATELTATNPQFWTGANRGFTGLVMVDGHLYAWAAQPEVNGAAVTPMTPTSTEVTATRSIFTSAAGGVELVAEWLSPVEPGDLQWQSVPLTLLTVTVSFTDGNTHDVQVYAEITGEWASANETAVIEWQQTSDATARYWTVGLQDPVEFKESDQMGRWGTTVWATPNDPATTYQSGYSSDLRNAFASAGELANANDPNPRAVDDQQPAFAFACDLGSSAGAVSFAVGHVRTPLITYGQSATALEPWWTQYWPGWQPMTAAFLQDAAEARTRAVALDAQVQQAAVSAAGYAYAAACALALRQCYAGTELAVGPNGDPWLLGKEISSSGDTNTVDIFDQAFLAWLWLDPALIPLVMAPILDWCASDAWQEPSAWAGIASWESTQTRYCVHDLGVYPAPPGRVPGNGEQMPIEESAGMLIMAAAYARAVGTGVAMPFLSQWQILWTQWAEYLMTQLPTPSEQLTTDDWVTAYRKPTGSVNLAIKAIVGLYAAGQIAEILGDMSSASTWTQAATDNIPDWIILSTDISGQYLNLQQGAHGTWSSLYNAYYQALFGVTLVPAQVAEHEATHYAGQMQAYGLPLQSGAETMSKAAWQFMLAAWLTDYPVAVSLLASARDFLEATPSLVPFGDRYDTTTAVEATGVQAHPSVGAVFALLAAGAQIPQPPPLSPLLGQDPPANWGSAETKRSVKLKTRRRKAPAKRPRHR